MRHRSENAIWAAISAGDITRAIANQVASEPGIAYKTPQHALLWGSVVSACPYNGNGDIRYLAAAIHHQSPAMRLRAVRTIMDLGRAINDLDGYQISCLVSRIRGDAPRTRRILLAGLLMPMIEGGIPENRDWWAENMDNLIGAEK